MGKRTGNPRGRPRGAKNKHTVEREIAVAQAAETIAQVLGPEAFDGDAHAFLMSVYKDSSRSVELRTDAAKAAIRYEKPALASVDSKVTGDLHIIGALTEDELDRIIRGAAAEAQISLGASGEGAETKH